MARQLTAENARESLLSHVAAKGIELRQKYGSEIGWSELQQILQDRTVVRYPCEIRFDRAPLRPGEIAFPEARGASPEEGFVMYVHPAFTQEPAAIVAIVLYQLVAVNYGEFASFEEAETFGAAALGTSRDEYYARLCEYADRLAEGAEAPACHGG